MEALAPVEEPNKDYRISREGMCMEEQVMFEALDVTEELSPSQVHKNTTYENYREASIFSSRQDYGMALDTTTNSKVVRNDHYLRHGHMKTREYQSCSPLLRMCT